MQKGVTPPSIARPGRAGRDGHRRRCRSYAAVLGCLVAFAGGIARAAADAGAPTDAPSAHDAESDAPEPRMAASDGGAPAPESEGSGGGSGASSSSPPPAPAPTTEASGSSAPSSPSSSPRTNATTEVLHGSGEANQLDELDLASLLENVVVTATKSELREDEAPAITTVVRREEIRRWGYQSVAEVLEHIAGVYVIDDHVLPNVGIRGVSGGLRSESGLVKVMTDGRSVAFRSTSGNWMGVELIPLSAIQQIEIIRGPASALYGADAFLGVINIVTRRPDQLEGGEATIAANRQRASLGWDADVGVGASAANGRVQFLGSFRTADEDRSGLRLPASSPSPLLPSYATPERQARGLTLRSKVALGTLSYQIGRSGYVRLTGYFSGIDRGAEFADWGQLSHGLDTSGHVNGTTVSLRHGFGSVEVGGQPTKTLNLRLGGMFASGGPTARDRIDVNSDVYYVRRDFGYRAFDVQAEANWRPHPTVTALAGAEMISDYEMLPVIYRVTKSAFDDTPAGDARPDNEAAGRVTLSNVGTRGLVVWTPRRWLNITAGARYDHHNIYGPRPSARLGGVLSLSHSLHIKLLYGSAFKAPSPQLLYGSPITIGDITGNPDLKPSYVHTVEGQVVLRPNAYLVGTTGVAASYVLDQAAFAQIGVNQVAQNISEVQSLSWESELRLDYRRRFSAYANLSITRTRRKLEDQGYVARLTAYPNIAYPTVVAHAGAAFPLPRLPLRVSVEGSYVSPRSSSETNTLEAGGRYELPSYFLLGGSLRTSNLEILPGRDTSFALIVRNALGHEVADPGFAGVDYPRRHRTVMATLNQQF